MPAVQMRIAPSREIVFVLIPLQTANSPINLSHLNNTIFPGNQTNVTFTLSYGYEIFDDCFFLLFFFLMRDIVNNVDCIVLCINFR